ncbi:MAG TPA: transcription antitermination factor NusB [Vicinamibacteria bacterium]|nr:transcription antitermination factor NusB [Vicinamibacteria bacterium]
MGARRKGRELALQMLYQWEVSEQRPEEIARSNERLGRSAEPTRDFAVMLFQSAVRRIEEIDALIAAQSARWRLTRMATVDRNILRLSVCEFIELGTPKNVVIDEAVELAKRYSSMEAAGFVNGVLDGIFTRLSCAQPCEP